MEEAKPQKKSYDSLRILKQSEKLKKYGNSLREFDKQYDRELIHKGSNKVWICWLQGFDNAPFIVNRCVVSIKEHMPQQELVLITAENMLDYVPFPEYILNKWKNGQITNAHMTDLLRLELLIRYGGMWMDVTVFCSGSDIPDYFLFHAFISMVLNFYEEDWKSIVPRDIAAPHELQFRLFDTYNENIWNDIKEQTPFHKLTYKIKSEDEKRAYFFSELLRKDQTK